MREEMGSNQRDALSDKEKVLSLIVMVTQVCGYTGSY